MVVLADPDSLLGMLHAAVARATHGGGTPPQEVWPLLIECVTNDPRLEQKCEEERSIMRSLVLERAWTWEHCIVVRQAEWQPIRA